MNDPALVDFMAQITAANAEMEAMKAMNTYREMRGETIAYGEGEFFEITTRMQNLSKTIGKLYSK